MNRELSNSVVEKVAAFKCLTQGTTPGIKASLLVTLIDARIETKDEDLLDFIEQVCDKDKSKALAGAVLLELGDFRGGYSMLKNAFTPDTKTQETQSLCN